MGNIFSNAGLVSQGMDDYTQRQQGLALGNQQVQTGQIGLEDLQRQNTSAQNLRNSVANSDPNTGRYGAIMSYAKQAQQNGDIDAAGKAQDAANSLLMQGRQDLAQSAIYGVDPKAAIERQKELFGAQNVGSVEFGTDHDGNHIVKLIKPDGSSSFFNATQFVASQKEPIKVGAGEKIVQPLTGKTLASNPKFESTRTGTIYDPATGQPVANTATEKTTTKDAEGNEYQTVYDAQGKVIAGGPQGSGTPSQPNIHKNLPVLEQITKSIYERPGMGTLDPTSGKVMPTDLGSRKAVLGNQLYMANRNLDPQTIADMVMKGKEQVNDQTGERRFVYNGRPYNLNGPTGNIPQQEQPSSPQPAPQKTAPNPIQKKPVEPSIPPRSFLGLEKYAPQPPRRGFSGDADYTKYQSMSDRQKLEYLRQKQSEKPAFSKGGKVTRYQANGL